MRNLQKVNLIFPLVTGVACLLLFIIWIDLLLSQNLHPLYDKQAVFAVFAAALFIFLLSFERSLVVQLICILITMFYFQRIIITYFFPFELDYHEYVGFTREQLSWTSIYLLLCVIAIAIGTIVGKFLPTRIYSQNGTKLYANDKYISFFIFRVRFARLCRSALILFIILTFFQMWHMFYGFGVTGSTYDSSETILKWIVSIPTALSPFVLFSFIYFDKKSEIHVLAKYSLILVFIAGFITASKGFLLGLLLSYYIIIRILNRPLPRNFYLKAFILILFSIFIFFPVMKMFRHGFITGDFSIEYITSLGNVMLSFSHRLGAFDWTNLWLSVPSDILPASASLKSEFIGALNKLVPGELISQPEKVNLAKLQVIVGRGFGDLAELGGHGENPAGLATAYIFFGKVGGGVYLMLWSALLVWVERTHIHSMWKFVLITNYLVVFMIGGGFIILQAAFYWYVLLSTLLSFILVFMSQVKDIILHPVNPI